MRCDNAYNAVGDINRTDKIELHRIASKHRCVTSPNLPTLVIYGNYQVRSFKTGGGAYRCNSADRDSEMFLREVYQTNNCV